MNVIRSVFLLLILGTLFVSFAFVSALPILTTNEESDAPEKIQNAEEQFKEAFTAIRRAEAAGAEENKIAVLIEDLSFALDLIDQVKRGYAQGNSTNVDEVIAQAEGICSQLKDEADQLREAALANSIYVKILLFSLVPVVALIVTLCVYYGLKWWRQSEVERVMKMGVRRKRGV